MDSVKASLTDMGLCTTINANSIAGTFNIEDHEEIKAFADILDESSSKYFPIKVRGSGYIHQSIFWLNVRNPSNRGLQKGGITAAINNWNDYFSVRFGTNNIIQLNQLNLQSNLLCLGLKRLKFVRENPIT